jgi:protease-4
MHFLKLLFTPITAPIVFIQNHFKATLFITILFIVTFNSDDTTLTKANMQEIVLKGTIMDPSAVLKQIDKAKNDTNIKGVLFVVNSGGGAVAPSVEIAYAIKELNAIKPVIAYASGTMASGSYYASIYSSKIFANPGSMVGSIGVIMQSADASKLLDTIGIKPQTVKIGAYKEAGTPTRAWNQKEKDELNKVIKSTYDMFVKDVADARNLDIKNHTIYADAHIFTASQAKEVGLIDDVTNITKAKSIASEIAKVQKPIWAKKDKMEEFMEKLTANTIAQIFTLNNLTLMAK